MMQMLTRNIAVVEDNDNTAKSIIDLIEKYKQDNQVNLNVIRFTNADDFLEDYQQIYSVVLMDIQMPGTDGMSAAYKLREIDKTISIIFITTMVQYAQKGYEVNAVSFMVKPVNYFDFSLKFKKALDISAMNENRNITLNTKNGICRISTDKIIYVEIIKHRLFYHLVDDVIEMTGVLSEVENTLKEYGFLRCNQCYLVNPRFIISVQGKELHIGNTSLQISRPRYNQFMKDLTNWYAGRINC
jgi:DNA-binding LytR/AlgR family response regulator